MGSRTRKSAPRKRAEVRSGKGSHSLPEGVDRVHGTVREGNYGLSQVLVTLHLAGGGGQQFFCSFAFFRVTGDADA